MTAKRKIAVILVTDITNFTKNLSRLSDEKVEELVKESKKIKRTIEKYKGTVIKSTGDGYLATFTSTKDAFACAKEICATPIKVNSTSLTVRVALHVGEFSEVDDDIYGSDVNLTFRICDALESGVAVTDVFLSLAKLNGLADTKFRYAGKFKVKGFKEAVKVYVWKGKFKETDDVKRTIRHASYWKRATAFYLDLVIFTTSIGILTAFLTTRIFRKHAKISQPPLEPKEVFELKIPGAEIEAGGGKLEIKTPKTEIETRIGKIVIKRQGKEIAKINYLKLSGIQLLLFSLYLALFWWSTGGQSPGKWLTQIRIRYKGGMPPPLHVCLLRSALLVALVIPAGAGIIIPVLLKQKLPHDTLTKTYVEDIS